MGADGRIIPEPARENLAMENLATESPLAGESPAKELQVAMDPRQATVLTSLVRHLRAFIAEIEPSKAEWSHAVAFLEHQDPALLLHVATAGNDAATEPHAILPSSPAVVVFASPARPVPPPKKPTGSAPWPYRSRP
jgi:Catechol dioxygenase N terminus